jgi:hypothetical protein
MHYMSTYPDVWDQYLQYENLLKAVATCGLNYYIIE